MVPLGIFHKNYRKYIQIRIHGCQKEDKSSVIVSKKAAHPLKTVTMKFGKLLAHTLIDVPDWPQIRYKEFKRRLNKRQTVERQHSLFATGEFKRALREDLQRINTFWLTKEAAFHETPPEPEAVQLLLRWLTINYLAVLKITKKHDKCQTII